MSLHLYLLRHGETSASRTDQFCGNLDPELTPEGTEMAQLFADAYRDLEWAAAYVSPMSRTQATAKPFCDAVNLPMNLRDGLKEISYGDWEGLTREEVRDRFGEDYSRWETEPAWNAPTGGETAVQVASRASAVITEILKSHTDGNVLIVSHKATLRLILCNLLGIDLGRYRDRIAAPVASVSVVRFGEYGPQLAQLGDRSHLSAELRSLPGT
ncbi:MAG: histidine phosphatase family protein [Fibrella sp.]|nr:histidine phosphatase family protein [Armatimonadota bacterium]